MIKAVNIVSKNIDTFINNMDINNILLQNFLYKPIISTNYLDLEEFKGD